MHLFINADFPYPKETPPEIKTRIIKHSKNPVFNQKFKVPISRRHTTFKRAVKNKGIKFVLCQKGGFLRSDKVIGSATVPLIELESKCGHHAVVEIIDGRKPTGAKVEIKFRIREPFEGAEMVSEDLQWVSLESTTTSVAKKAEMKIDIRALSVIKTEIGHCDTRRKRLKIY
jgi:coiled-coil and C2 domain-containing protein 1